MHVILSAHFDLAKKVNFIKVDHQAMHGLVDNFAGVFAAYDAARKTGAELYLTNYEEVNLGGAMKVAKEIGRGKKDVIVIVVDTCTDAKIKKAYIGNAYNVDYEGLKRKFAKDIFFQDGLYEPDMDETAIYGPDYKLPTFFFGVPIKGEYHATDNKVTTKTIDEASKLLVQIINYFQKKKVKQ